METVDCKLIIEEEYFFNNGKIVRDHLGDFALKIKSAISKEILLNLVERKEKGKPSYLGIKADELNKKLRELIITIPGLNKETHVKNGIFYHKTKEGFDFSCYDKINNMNRLRNYYIGVNGIYNGDKEINYAYTNLGIKSKEWNRYLSSIKESNHKDIITEKNCLTVVGEFQFGNWALVYRDLFRLLNADANPGVDFYIYITSTGNLKNLLSKNTVCFNDVVRVLQENRSIIKTPIWLIGLDVSLKKQEN